MNTSTATLCRLLNDFSPVAFGTENGFDYDGFCLYSEASEENRDRLIYVAEYSGIVPRNNLPSAVCYICINDTFAKIESPSIKEVPMIVLNTDANLNDIFSILLQDFFHRSQLVRKFKDSLLDMMAAGASMSMVLQAATKEFSNPFIVFDSNFSLVAHSVSPSITLPEAQKVVSNRYANVDVLQKLADNGVMDMLQHSARPILVNLPNGYKKLAVNLFDNMECVGMVGFYNYVRDFEEGDYEIVAFVAKLVGSYFHKSDFAPSVWTPYDYVFNYLLTNDEPLPVKTITDLKLSFPPQMRLMSISFSHMMQMQDVPLKFIEASVKKMLPKSQTYIHAQNVLFLCRSASLEKESAEEFFEWLGEFLTKHHLFAGISNTFSDLSDFRKVYDESTAAAAIGPNIPYTNPIFFYVDYTVPHMMKLLNRSSDIKRFYHPAFTTLMEYDRQYNTQYTECLMVYLKFNGNMTECANYFSIHYNSIKYRMKVIQDICGIDIHDINTFVHLYLSYMIHELYGSERGPELNILREEN